MTFVVAYKCRNCLTVLTKDNFREKREPVFTSEREPIGARLVRVATQAVEDWPLCDNCNTVGKKQQQ
jgi:hypothetical protein